MFNAANAFNQNLSNWSIASLTTATEMLTGTAISQDNYNALLEGWAKQVTIQHNVVFDQTGLDATTPLSTEAKNKLVDVYAWTIS